MTPLPPVRPRRARAIDFHAGVLGASALLAAGALAAAAAGAGASGKMHQAPDVDVRLVVGEPEVVMDYSAESCPASNGMDLPDVQARAFRRPGDDHIVLVSGNAPDNYFMTGPDFDHLERDCRAVLTSGDRPDAASFDNQEWILAAYRTGRTVHALVHNEYHDPEAANCRPGVSDTTNPCWFNAITYAVSTDAGSTFHQGPAPGHVVAALPRPWDPTARTRPLGAPPPHGYFTPSNVVHGPDGLYYSMFMAIPDPADPRQGTCVMRTADLADPSSWRAWDGDGFDLAMPSPYDADGDPAPTGSPPCTPVSQRAIGSLHGSLTYSSYLERYVLVGTGAYSSGGTTTCGTHFSLSRDLVEWSQPQLIMAGKLPHAPCNPDGSPDGSVIYPSLIDHKSPSPSFETIGTRPHLYYVQWHRGLDRDLMRVPLSFHTAREAYLPLAVTHAGRPAPAPAPTATTTPPGEGLERVVALLVDDGGSADARLEPAAVRAPLDDVVAWYAEVSYGRSRFTFDVRGWYGIPMTAGSSTDPRVFAAAVSDGVDFLQYDHVLVLFHGGTGAGSSHSGHGVVVSTPDGPRPLEATLSQVTRVRDTDGTRGVIVHELGHALGLPHANHLSQLTGMPVAYGTQTDVMGASFPRGHFGAYYKHRLGWIDAADVITATGSGVFTIRPLETDSGSRLLVVPVPGPGDQVGRLTLQDYVVETRRPIGHDTSLRLNVFDGALIHRLSPLPAPDEESGARRQTISLDASPETPSQYSDDFALMPGRTYSDPVNAIHITVLAVEDTGTTVQVVRDSPATNAPPAIASVSAPPSERDPLELAFAVDASDPDGDPLSVFWNFEVVSEVSGTGGRGRVTRYAPGNYGSGAAAVRTFPDATPRSACALVSDRRGGTAAACVDLFGATNEPPVVKPAVSPRGPGTVALAANIADDQPTWVRWDFGDGLGTDFVTPEHTYDPPGETVARVTVSDGQHTVSVDVPVDSRQSENRPPIADAGPDQVVAPGATVRLDGSASYDPDQYPISRLRYIWTAPPGIEVADPRAARTSFTAPSATGPYTFTLQVYDGAVYASDETVVTVRCGTTGRAQLLARRSCILLPTIHVTGTRAAQMRTATASSRQTSDSSAPLAATSNSGFRK
jgi:M6 family metalloprotease-like protein